VVSTSTSSDHMHALLTLNDHEMTWLGCGRESEDETMLTGETPAQTKQIV
jgi:hypothetical protein